VLESVCIVCRFTNKSKKNVGSRELYAAQLGEELTARNQNRHLTPTASANQRTPTVHLGQSWHAGAY
jgi:hypothetical protein